MFVPRLEKKTGKLQLPNIKACAVMLFGSFSSMSSVASPVVWSMMNRIRAAMVNDGELLTGLVEMDETYVGGVRDAPPLVEEHDESDACDLGSPGSDSVFSPHQSPSPTLSPITYMTSAERTTRSTSDCVKLRE